MMASQEKRTQKGPCDILRTFGGGKRVFAKTARRQKERAFSAMLFLSNDVFEREHFRNACYHETVHLSFRGGFCDVERKRQQG